MYRDFRKRDIISKYIKEVRIKTFTDINTPTLQIDIYYNLSDLSDKPLSIYYSYRQMNENKRLFRFIFGHTKEFYNWNDIYLQKIEKKKEKTINKRSADRIEKKNALIGMYDKNPNLTAAQYQNMLREVGVEIALPSLFVYLREIKKK
jgi:hypothetical protein